MRARPIQRLLLRTSAAHTLIITATKWRVNLSKAPEQLQTYEPLFHYQSRALSDLLCLIRARPIQRLTLRTSAARIQGAALHRGLTAKERAICEP